MDEHPEAPARKPALGGRQVRGMIGARTDRGQGRQSTRPRARRHRAVPVGHLRIAASRNLLCGRSTFLRSAAGALEFWRMEEPEVPTEHLHEHMEQGAHASKASWVMGVALSSALLAGLAAVCSSPCGPPFKRGDEGADPELRPVGVLRGSKGIKAAVLQAKIAILQSGGRPESDADRSKLADYTRQQDEIQELAKEKQRAADAHLARHVVYVPAASPCFRSRSP